MYGDCHVLSSIMGIPPSAGGSGGLVSPESLFSSSPIRNAFLPPPPFHHHLHLPPIIPKEEMSVPGVGKRDDEMESNGSGSGYVEGICWGEEENYTGSEAQALEQQQQPGEQPSASSGKRKRYHRHTPHQIQVMETMFRECPHPDDKQRQKLSEDLGLKPRQVKFWFQNRRTQMKAQQDRSDNVVLRAENDNLKTENYRLQAAIRSVACPGCGGPAVLGEMSVEEQHLRLENARLKEELNRLSCIMARCGGRPLPGMMMPSLELDMGMFSRNFSTGPVLGNCTDLIPAVAAIPDAVRFPPLPAACTMVAEEDHSLALEAAMTAADHLVRMVRMEEPLWTRTGTPMIESLNVEEHKRLFSWPLNGKPCDNPDCRAEGTRGTAMVIMNSITLVDAFMDANKWMELFPCIVSSSRTVQVVNPGMPSHGNGSLHLMYTELQFLSPLVPVREGYFLRYCQHDAVEGTWTIVDFPVDGLLQDETQHQPSIISRYKRHPSGCLIQDMPNGYSKVTWVEHVEVEEKPVHQIFEQYVSTGKAFGATQWLAVLQGQCERLASLMARNISDLGVIPTLEARKNIMKLSQRMTRTFFHNVSRSGAQSWTSLPDSSNDTIRVVDRKNTELGQPNGVIICGVSTTRLPFSHCEVLDLLADEHRRSQLDVLSNGNSLHEIAHIANGSHPRNCISLLRVNGSSNSSQNVELLLQESITHPNGGSMVVYSTIDVDAVQVAMSGEDPSYIPLLPMGFIMYPADNPLPDGNGVAPPAPAGCLLTVGVQVLASAVPSARINLSSVAAINSHLCNVVHQIGSVLGSVTRAEPPVLGLPEPYPEP